MSHRSTTKILLKVPRNKRNLYVNYETIKEAAPAIQYPPGIQHHQTRTNITSEEVSTVPEAESTMVLITPRFTLRILQHQQQV